MYESSKSKSVVIYTLSDCEPCEKTIYLLEELNVKYDNININEASPEEREEAITVFGEDIPEGGMEIAFPIIKIGEELITGYDEKKIRAKLK